MQQVDMKVILVNRQDYDGILLSIWGLRNVDSSILEEADLIVDQDTGKILKSRHF